MLNKVVIVFEAVSFGFILWDEIKQLAGTIALVKRLRDEDKLEAFIDMLDALNPNTPWWLEWQIIKALANELDD